MSVLIEVAVDTAQGLAEAIRGGAGRVELCSALGLGGLTPSVGLMRRASGADVPVFAMIRPRAGDFVWSPDEMAVMEADIHAARDAGLQGVVLGASRPDGRLDTDVLRLLIGHAAGIEMTLHRCFDLVPDPFAALEQAIDLGFQRILTSGAALKAPQGAALIEALIEHAKGRIIIMPGAGVTAATVSAFVGLELHEVHSSCSAPIAASGAVVDFGFAQSVSLQTDAALVRALHTALMENFPA